jgi:phosphatidylinositol alpha-mannosyltransferase
MNASRADLQGSGHRRRLLAVIVTLAVLAGLFVLGATNLDLHAVGHALGRVNGGWIVVALVLMAAAFYARAESWFAVLRAAVRGQSLERGAVRRALLIGLAGSTVAPGRLGEGARAWIVSRRLGQPSRTLATVLGTVVSQTFLNLLALALLAIAAVLDSALANARTGAILAVVSLPAALIALALAGPRVLRCGAAAPVTWVKAAATWTLNQVLRFRQGLAVFRQPGPAVHATAAQLSAWALQLGACYVVMLGLGLGHRANVAAAAAVLLAVNVTAIVPVTPSNVGVFQAACIAVLHPFGIEANRALAYGLILQAVEVFDALALAIPALLREGLPWAELRRQARTRLAAQR